MGLDIGGVRRGGGLSSTSGMVAQAERAMIAQETVAQRNFDKDTNI